MADAIVLIILVLVVGGASAYLIRIGRKTIQISGMTCGHCAASVEERLNLIDGVRAEVSMSKGNAVVFYDREIDDTILKNAVEKAGFTVDSIRVL